jgi:methylenetetrahydrofolate dehydrogenase (NADP+)/methenyltetrahydrofolate cyclohydrolase
MALILRGKEAAAAVMDSLKSRTAALAARGIVPVLGILRVGEKEDDRAYEGSAIRRCEAAGVKVRSWVFPADVPEALLLDRLRSLNEDGSVHGILALRPLPAHIDDAALRKTLRPEKDVDGITEGSLAGVFTGGTKFRGFPPCTAEACMELLGYHRIGIEGRRAVVIGRSLVVGRPAAMLLMHRNATVTVCHTRTGNLAAVVREGDIVIAAAGRPESLGKDCFREGQSVIDVGIHVKPGGGLCGDVRFDEVEKVVAALSPVPGGVGPLTSVLLVRHVIEAAEIAAGR